MYGYGLTLAQYEAMSEEQQHVCAICGGVNTSETKPERLSVDHNHETGRIRGLLCGNCNRGLGLFGEDQERMFKAIEYLMKWETS
jgi:hypothetical protein